jgi:hypothetical protein
LGLAGDGQGSEHDGQVSLDAVFEAVKHGPDGQIGLGHPEGTLDLAQVVVAATIAGPSIAAGSMPVT